MRKGTAQIIAAFINGKRLTIKNTRTDGQSIYYHGNLIAWRNEDGTVFCTLAGWGTPTTRERLNALAQKLTGRGGFSQRKHVQYYNDQPIDEREIIQLV